MNEIYDTKIKDINMTRDAKINESIDNYAIFKCTNCNNIEKE